MTELLTELQIIIAGLGLVIVVSAISFKILLRAIGDIQWTLVGIECDMNTQKEALESIKKLLPVKKSFAESIAPPSEIVNKNKSLYKKTEEIKNKIEEFIIKNNIPPEDHEQVINSFFCGLKNGSHNIPIDKQQCV